LCGFAAGQNALVLIIMESSPVRTLFKTIMKGQESPAVRDLEVINLIYPVTMEEITVPVRNRGCA
jgi:hypothetical protein